MPRRARVVVPGIPHHVTQRGVRRSDVFVDAADRKIYLSMLRDAARRFGVRFRAYCLMTNHVHFVAVPEQLDSLWKAFHFAHTRYAVWFNEKHGLSGHLFQGCPFSSPLDDRRYWTAIRYVERNPVRAGMTLRSEDYLWSSARAHCGGHSDPLLDPDWIQDLKPADWSDWLAAAGTPEEIQFIRERTFSGQPCGDSDFVHRIETIIGRSFVRRKPGPKPKGAAAEQTSLLWDDREAE
jgi:putative transposase